MSVQIESPGQLQDLLDILKRRRWQVLLPFLVVAVLGSAFAVLVPKKFEVTTEVELRETLVSEDGRASESMATRDVHNAPMQIKSLKRIRASVEELEWDDYASLGSEAEKTDYLKDLQEDLYVNIPRKAEDTGSTFVTISFLHVDKQRALDFLMELRQRWTEEVVEIDRVAVESKFEKLKQLLADNDRELEEKFKELAQLRASHSISPTQPATTAGQSRQEDYTFELLRETQEALADLQLEIASDEDAIELLEGQLAETTPYDTREETLEEGESYDRAIEVKKRQLIDWEVKLGRYRPAHSKYAQIQNLMAELEEEIRLLEESRTEDVIEKAFDVPNPEYTRLETQLAEARRELEQKKRNADTLIERISELEGQMQELQEVYAQIDALTTRIGSLKTTQQELALDLQRTTTRREEILGPAGNPFQVTEEAQLPLTPTEPNPWLLVAFSVIAGLALGLGLALLLEFSRSCFRNPGDISRVMVVPVLGVVNRIATRAQQRRRLMRRASVAAVTVTALGMVVIVTWTWRTEPERLPNDVLDAIEDFRRLFR